MAHEVSENPIEGELIPQYIKPPNFQRPNRYTPLEMAENMAEYFTYRFNSAKPFTWAGIALNLGFHRQSLDNYASGEYGTTEAKKQYVDVCKWARCVIEDEREGLLMREKGNVTGIIFALKQVGYDWRDGSSLSIDYNERHELVVMLPHILADKLSDAAGERIGTEVALPREPASD